MSGKSSKIASTVDYVSPATPRDRPRRRWSLIFVLLVLIIIPLMCLGWGFLYGLFNERVLRQSSLLTIRAC